LNADGLGCYKFLYDKAGLMLFDAQYECELLGGYLAEPKTQREMEFLSSVADLEFELTGIRYWHLGLIDIEEEGNWYWMHSHQPAVWTSWGPGEPDTSSVNKEDCAALYVSKDYRNYWMDHSCLDTRIGLEDIAPLCQYSL